MSMFLGLKRLDPLRLPFNIMFRGTDYPAFQRLACPAAAGASFHKIVLGNRPKRRDGTRAESERSI